MPKTIVLTNLVITAWTYFPVILARGSTPARVEVSYQLQDTTGHVYESGVAVFWAGAPHYPAGMLPPDNFYTLPALRATQLTQLTDLMSATLAKLLT